MPSSAQAAATPEPIGKTNEAWGATAAEEAPTQPDAALTPQKDSSTSSDCCESLGYFVAYWFGAHRFDHFIGEETPVHGFMQHWRQENKHDVKVGQNSGGKAGGKGEGKASGTGGEAIEVNKVHVTGPTDESEDPLRTAATAEGDEAWHDGHVLTLMHYPIFTVVWIGFVSVLWAVCALKDGKDLAGFESIWPKETDLAIVDVQHCTDHRAEIWRWWTYQFSHVGASHVVVNCIMMGLFGIPLEGWHGHVRTFLMFQLGVVGGALCYMVWDNHTRVVGMSGGCYALLGMHVADIAMNYKDKKFAAQKIVLLLVVVALDVVQVMIVNSPNASHSAHLGGFVAGLLLCIFIGYNKDILGWEIILKVIAVVISIVLTVSCLSFGLQWAPMELQDPVRWCWLRQVISPEHFGDNKVHCVRCDSQACIDKWNATRNAMINVRTCFKEFGGFDRSER